MSNEGKVFTNECKFNWAKGEGVEGILSGIEVGNTQYGQYVVLEIEGEDRLHRVVTSNSLLRQIKRGVSLGDTVRIEYGGREIEDDPDSKKIFCLTLIKAGELQVSLEQAMEDAGFDFEAAKMKYFGGESDGA